MHMSVHRKNCTPYFTEKDLEDLDDMIEAFQEKFQATIAPLMACKGKTIKMHKLSHITTGIRQMGEPKHENAQFMEQQHALIKAIYNGGYKRTREDADLDDVVRRARLHAMAKAGDNRDLSETRQARETVFMMTAREGRPNLAQSGKSVLLEHLSAEPLSVGGEVIPDSVKDLKAAQPELSMLPQLLQEYAADHGLATRPQTIKVVNTGCIPGRVSSNVGLIS